MQPTQRIDRTGALDVSLELAANSWKLAATDGKRPHPAVLVIDVAPLWARLQALLCRLRELQRKWRLPQNSAVHVIFEAGQDGFWIARALQAEGIEVIVVDAASV